ncbi:hypothetical protein C7E25_23670, partial [Stenotrophomonas maltophilia]
AAAEKTRRQFQASGNADGEIGALVEGDNALAAGDAANAIGNGATALGSRRRGSGKDPPAVPGQRQRRR